MIHKRELMTISDQPSEDERSFRNCCPGLRSNVCKRKVNLI